MSTCPSMLWSTRKACLPPAHCKSVPHLVGLPEIKNRALHPKLYLRSFVCTALRKACLPPVQGARRCSHDGCSCVCS